MKQVNPLALPIALTQIEEPKCNFLDINFGKGLIGVTPMVKDFAPIQGPKVAAVRFDVLKEAGEIGVNQIDSSTDPAYPVVYMNFTNEKSVDVVIKALEIVKKNIRAINTEIR